MCDVAQYEVTTCILAMLIGATTFSYVVGNMASLIAKLDGNSGAFREKMDQATSFMHENNIPKDLKLRIRKYYDYSFNHPLVDISNSMLRDLSPALHTEVVRYIRRDVLATVSLFQSMHNKHRRHLLSTLQSKLTPSQHGPGDYIFHVGEVGKAVYVIVAGEVDLVDPDTREVFATFRKGNYFGENALLPDEERRPFAARARTWCDIFALRVKDMDIVLHDYATISSSVRLTARLRWARLIKAFEAHRVLMMARERKMHLNGKTLLRVMAQVDQNGAQTHVQPGSPTRSHTSAEEYSKQPSSVRAIFTSKFGRSMLSRAHPVSPDKEEEHLTADEEELLFKDLRSTVLGNEVGKQLAAGVRVAGPSGWDWSRDWVDGGDILGESERLQKQYNGAALADKALRNTVGQPGNLALHGKLDHDDFEPASPNYDLAPEHVTPGVELERALQRIIQRLDVIEAQTDMHQVLLQLRRMNQLMTERQEMESQLLFKRGAAAPAASTTSVRMRDLAPAVINASATAGDGLETEKATTRNANVDSLRPG
jgi:CRP-like cAMP-binding protein